MPNDRVRLLPLLGLVALCGCASLGSSKDQSVAQWQEDSKQALKEGTPEAEQDLRESLQRERARLEGVLGQHFAQAELSDDVILGTKTFNSSYQPDTFEHQLQLLRKYDVVPELETPENRDRGKFYRPPTAETKARLQKLYKQKQLLDELRIALANTEAIGMYLVAEQRDTLKLNWSVELYSLQFAAKIRAFEQRLETEVSDETLREMAAIIAIRDQTRMLMVTHTAMLAAFDGVAAGGDPSAVTELAKASKAQIGTESDIGTDEARGYVSSLGGESLDVAAALEASMRDAVGDEAYVRHYQGDLVRALKVAEEAEAEVSIYAQIDDTARAAKLREFQQTARTAQERLTERAKQLAGDHARRLLEALPYGKQVLAGLRALRELRNGNARGAIEAAIEAAPAGPIQSGMQLAAKIGFTAADAAKQRRRRS